MALTPNDQSTSQGAGWTDSLSDNIFFHLMRLFWFVVTFERVFFKDRHCFHVVKDMCLIFQLNGYIYLYLAFESEGGMGRGSDEPFFYWASSL